ncbi:plasmid stabilization protein (plasmid) [Candidatus Megaera polyxenophila]|jgi:plasmid stabilization system protein ParE|uniref:type II toxin-antitoxin system RelE/ParE family toxin n=1 Tax=Candidatus Megaera polyxenophila TaxID=988779 RepID=UPI00249DFEDD|nr:type II toxin-antitoxin system RelE/ParE family toxin [Candidatus Megaera polyxenophila]BBB57622.1 plasmid stabilization protein [Candidatus Megaera polyxenophila]
MKYTIFWSKSAVRDLQRVRDFLKNISPNAANNAATQINQYTQKLAMFPLAGKPVEMLEGYYDLFIPFAAGYSLRYRVYKQAVYVIFIKHSKELND